MLDKSLNLVKRKYLKAKKPGRFINVKKMLPCTCHQPLRV